METAAPDAKPDFNHYWSAALKHLYSWSQTPGKAVTPANRTNKLAQEGRNVIEEVEGAVKQTKKTAKKFAEAIPDEPEARAVCDSTKERAYRRRNGEIIDRNVGWRPPPITCQPLTTRYPPRKTQQRYLELASHSTCAMPPTRLGLNPPNPP